MIPGSKSTSARSLLLAALASGPSTLRGLLRARDTDLMRAGLGRLGVRFIDLDDEAVQVLPPGAFRGGAVIDVGLAGTVMRFLPPIAALATGATRFVGDPAMANRPVAPLLGALAELGAEVSLPYRVPFEVTGGPAVRGGAVTLDSSGSSQFISGLLLAGARLPQGLAVQHAGDSLPSLPHIEMTVRMLAERGVRIDHPTPLSWQVHPGPISPLDEQVEPDLTNAASLLAAALVTGGRLTTAWPEGSLQGADDLAAALEAFGAEISYRGGGSSRRITVQGPERLHGVDLDLHATSELTPVAAALATLADSPSTIRGVAHIRHHETDRLAALESELTALGGRVRQTGDGLRIEPAPLRGGIFHTYADHRLAHAGALLGLAVPGIELDDVGCTSKTLPDFPALWTGLVDR
ncbi:MAG: 3-phosphoshikimate 1-carboxyvinyltransferase [Propionibacteriaceae bacterium]|nr:3-phosphoshikimate 1-carboxyvinyltransferase [Propionibacteriaceae bacterium]